MLGSSGKCPGAGQECRLIGLRRVGVTDVDWSKHWMQAFDKLGADTAVDPFRPICRAAGHGGDLRRRSVVC